MELIENARSSGKLLIEAVQRRARNKVLTAKEASLLALLAQIAPHKELKRRHSKRIIRSLKGDALKVARVIAGDSRATGEIGVAADGFKRWAGSLSFGKVGKP